MADYTPTLGTFTELKPFRYWCQKVLPLVYDDSLSYYELLCKVVDYLNKTMEDVDTLHDDVVNLHAAYVQLQEYVNTYFDNLDVQNEINNKLDDMAEDGSLSALISPFIPDLVTAWLDENVTPTTPAVDATLTISEAAADAKKTGDAIAPVYSSSTKYKKGDIVNYNGGIYSCIYNMSAAEVWNSAHWRKITLGKEIKDTESGLIPYNAFNAIDAFFNPSNTTSHNVTFTWTGYTCQVSGTSDATTVNNIIPLESPLPNTLKAGNTYPFIYECDDENIQLGFIFYKSNNETIYRYVTKSGNVEIPVDTIKIGLRLYISANKTVNGTVSNVAILTQYSNKMLEDIGLTANGILRNNTDLNDIHGINGFYTLNSSSTYTHLPESNSYGGMLIVYTPTSTITEQVVYNNNPNGSNWHRYYLTTNNTWSAWINDKGLTPAGVLGNNADLNTMYGMNKFYLINSSTTYTNLPESMSYGGMLIVYAPTSTVTEQVVYNNNPNGSNWHRYYLTTNNTWSAWIKDTHNTHQNIYNFETYNNTYNVTATPSITTDTNNYLASTGTTADRKNDIESMLAATGVCKLGPGAFYVSGVDLPTYGLLEGCGNATKVILLDSVTNGYAVNLGTYSSVRNLRIIGSLSNYTPAQTVGTRHGILWSGTASESQSGSSAPFRGTIENVSISDFNGGGITLYNTGLAWSSSISATDVYINRCDAGINIPFFSEFNRFTNVASNECYYGCICNGGNNFFVNCSLSGNTVGLLMDNENDQARNNAHGSFIGCNFHHSGNPMNTGTAIKIIGINNNELFSGCQLGFGLVDIEDANRIAFVGCAFGNGVSLKIASSVATIFGNCTFYNPQAMTVTITNSATTVFNGCYDNTGAEVDFMNS